jgi:hypothetical protein
VAAEEARFQYERPWEAVAAEEARFQYERPWEAISLGPSARNFGFRGSAASSAELLQRLGYTAVTIFRVNQTYITGHILLQPHSSWRWKL